MNFVRVLKQEDPRAWFLTDLDNMDAIYMATCTESLWGCIILEMSQC